MSQCSLYDYERCSSLWDLLFALACLVTILLTWKFIEPPIRRRDYGLLHAYEHEHPRHLETERCSLRHAALDRREALVLRVRLVRVLSALVQCVP